MIPAELEAKIRRFYHAERWPVGTIARHLALHHSTVRRALLRDGVPLQTLPTRPSKADPYVPFILETLKSWPELRASRLYEMVKERGYDGGPDHFRAIIARYRPRKAAEAFLRLSTLPGSRRRSTGATSGTSRSMALGARWWPSSWCSRGPAGCFCASDLSSAWAASWTTTRRPSPCSAACRGCSCMTTSSPR